MFQLGKTIIEIIFDKAVNGSTKLVNNSCLLHIQMSVT